MSLAMLLLLLRCLANVLYFALNIICLTGHKSTKARFKKSFPSLWLCGDCQRHGWTQRSDESVW